MWESDLAIFLIIATLSLDNTHIFQGNFGRPIVGGIIIGLLIGNLPLGLLFGVIFQPLWLAIIPVGGTFFPEGGIATMYMLWQTNNLIKSGIQLEEIIFPAILLTVAFAIFAGSISLIERKINTRLLISHEKKSKLWPAYLYISWGIFFHLFSWLLIMFLLSGPVNQLLKQITSIEQLQLPIAWSTLGTLSIGLVLLIREEESKRHWKEAAFATIMGGALFWLFA